EPGELHVHDEFRLHVMPIAGRPHRLPFRNGFVDLERFEARQEVGDGPLVEAATDATAKYQSIADVGRNLERAERFAPALAVHPSDDDEIGFAVALDLDPVLRSLGARPIVRGRLLRDDAFEADRLAQLVDGPPVSLEVIEQADDAATRND